MIRNKTIKFNLDKQEDRELWEWLKTLPHGSFSEETKGFFRREMEERKYWGNSVVEKLLPFQTDLNKKGPVK